MPPTINSKILEPKSIVASAASAVALCMAALGTPAYAAESPDNAFIENMIRMLKGELDTEEIPIDDAAGGENEDAVQVLDLIA